MSRENLYKLCAITEILLAIVFICFDLLMPTLLILGLAILSLLYRKEKLKTLGFRKQDKAARMIGEVFLLAVAWTLLDFGLFLPLLNHATGTTQDLSTFKELKGNLGMLGFMLAASWILAALGEEVAYRGFIQTRLESLIGISKLKIPLAVGLTAMLFGFAHTEQGVVGVVITTLDALFFSFLRYRYDNLWASVLAHGFLNTIGVITFFFTGPLYGLW